MHLFSNTNRAHHAFWSKRYEQALRPMGERFISCEIGLRKPEPASFQHVAARLGIPLERILFFDDTAANVDAARALVVKAVLVGSPDDVTGALRPWV